MIVSLGAIDTTRSRETLRLSFSLDDSYQKAKIFRKFLENALYCSFLPAAIN